MAPKDFVEHGFMWKMRIKEIPASVFKMDGRFGCKNTGEPLLNIYTGCSPVIDNRRIWARYRKPLVGYTELTRRRNKLPSFYFRSIRFLDGLRSCSSITKQPIYITLDEFFVHYNSSFGPKDPDHTKYRTIIPNAMLPAYNGKPMKNRFETIKSLGDLCTASTAFRGTDLARVPVSALA